MLNFISKTFGYFKLVLRNNIVAWQLIQDKKIETDNGEQGLEQLDELDRQILSVIAAKGSQSRTQLTKALGNADKTVSTYLRHLTDLQFLIFIGGKTNPNRVHEPHSKFPR